MSFFGNLFNSIKDVATRVFNTVKDPVSMLWNKVADPLLKTLGPVGNVISTVGNVGGDILTGEYKNAAKNLGKGLLNAYGNPLRNIPVVGNFVGDAAQKALGLAMGGKVNGMKGDMTKDKYTRGLEGETKKNVFQK